MKKHCTIKVYGTVHGVGFRITTKELAEKLGITGIVRNESDGTVYIEAQGEEDQLKELVKQCRQGHSHFQVSEVETHWSNETGQYHEFVIAR
jgi:acylphosphatase